MKQTLRSIGAVLGGYLTMVLGVSTLLALLFFAFRDDFPREPGPYEGPAIVLVLELLGGFIAAVVGGFVCALIARRAEMKHAYALVALLVPLSAISLYVDAGLKPLWSSLLTPVVAIAGVLLGARLRARRASPKS